jgi:hypothetical protein
VLSDDAFVLILAVVVALLFAGLAAWFVVAA